ncbi:MAG: glycosyltransferase family 2 protein [Lachnospiraceae bacterium]|nr:glycosyltransferase family 2 protein [Lachnospiraceae bacterium]
MFKISIIIPCYNASQYIDRCLTSIVKQTIGVNSLQIICVDDASTDNTWHCLQQWEQRYPNNIILVHLDENSRQGTARNIAIQYVEASWITFIDADDWIEIDFCEIMHSFATGLECDIVRCNMKRDSSKSLTYFQNRETDIPNQYLIIDSIDKRKNFMVNHMLGHTACDKLVRTSLLTDNQILFADHLAYEEIPWHSLLHAYASKVFILGSSLYHYYTNPNSTTSVQNADYHVDILTSSLFAWQTWKDHDLFLNYKNELEYNLIFYGYLFFLKTIFSSSNPSYSFYLMAREIILDHIPDYSLNPYILRPMSQADQLLINFLDQRMDSMQFEQLFYMPETQ